MAQIFRGLPGMDRLLAYWYHYAIMFEALFILTTIDAGTRVARYVMQELLGRAHQRFANTAWVPGNLIATSICRDRAGVISFTRETSPPSGRCSASATSCWPPLRWRYPPPS